MNLFELRRFNKFNSRKITVAPSLGETVNVNYLQMLFLFHYIVQIILYVIIHMILSNIR